MRHADVSIRVTVNGQRETTLLDLLRGRTGLDCAPLVHAALGTAPTGAVRFSLGSFTREDGIDAAMAEIAGTRRGR
jgi:selenocysteine lyase/cysteine desulfurase